MISKGANIQVECPPLLRLLLSVFLLSLATSCSFSRTETMLSLAKSHHLTSAYENHQGFSLLTLQRFPTTNNTLLKVYVEGDGFAWVHRNQLSKDPTPKNPLALKLMLQDSTSTALYLARPCHYPPKNSPICSPYYWSSHRYAPEVVLSMSQAIDSVKKRMKIKKIGLIGYSGGGVIAALLSAQRTDVQWLVTVASNLDVNHWTKHHKVSPMPDSLNPIDFAPQLSKIPQFHFVGAQDQQIPPSVVHSYNAHLPSPKDVTIRSIEHFNHTCCWEKQWRDLLSEVSFVNHP